MIFLDHIEDNWKNSKEKSWSNPDVAFMWTQRIPMIIYYRILTIKSFIEQRKLYREKTVVDCSCAILSKKSTLIYQREWFKILFLWSDYFVKIKTSLDFYVITTRKNSSWEKKLKC